MVECLLLQVIPPSDTQFCNFRTSSKSECGFVFHLVVCDWIFSFSVFPISNLYDGAQNQQDFSTVQFDSMIPTSELNLLCSFFISWLAFLPWKTQEKATLLLATYHHSSIFQNINDFIIFLTMTGAIMYIKEEFNLETTIEGIVIAISLIGATLNHNVLQTHTGLVGLTPYANNVIKFLFYQ